MATVQETVRRLTIESTSRGVSETTDKLKQLHQAQQGVVVTSREKERATQSMERRLQSIQRQYDANYRATQQMARIERDLKAAVDQGLISATRKNELMTLAAARHSQAATAAGAHRVALAGLNTQMAAMQGMLAGMAMGGLMRLAAGAGAVLSGSAFVTATAEQEKVMAQLDAVIRSTGGAAGYTSEELAKMATGLQALTTYGDEAVMGAQAMLLTFTRIGRDVFPQALEAILNVSAAMNQDLKSSTVQIGKALNDPIAGLTALARVGIQFTKEQKEQIKTLQEAGNVMGAQKVILAELEVQFGGSARAARDTLGGALVSLKNAFGDLFEVSGPAAEKLRNEIERLISLLQDPRTQGAMQDFGSAVLGELTSIIQTFRNAYLEITWMINQIRSGNFAGVAPMAFGEGAERRLAERSLRIGIGNRLTQAEANQFYNATGQRLPQPSGGPRGGQPAGEDKETAAAKLNEYDRAARSIEKQTQALEIQAKTFGMTTEEAARYRIEQELRNAATRAGVTLTEQDEAKIRSMAEAYATAAAQMEKLNEMRSVLNGMASTITTGLADILDGTKTASQGFQDMARSVLRALQEMLIKMLIVMPIVRALQSSLGGGMFGFGSGAAFAGPVGQSSVVGPMPSALGNAFDRGNVIPFAGGGIVDHPTLFPMANGAGLMGEAGPEAIMPLRRGSDGRLGVETRGGGLGNFTYAPVIDASGADKETVARLQKLLMWQMREIARLTKGVSGAEYLQRTGVVRA